MTEIKVSALKELLEGNGTTTGVLAPESITVKELIEALAMWEDVAPGYYATASTLFDMTIR